MLGYVFKQKWAESNPALVSAFSDAISSTKQNLSESEENWRGIRKLMKAKDDQVYILLRQGYIDGIPDLLDQNQIEDASTFYQLVRSTSGKFDWPESFDKNTFWINDNR